MSPSRYRIPVVVALCVLLAGGLAACGKSQATRTQADTEGPYLDVGALKYQVQISRQLNPQDIEDQVYLRGIAPQDSRLRPDETWFAVFVRAVNEGDRAEPAARNFEIEDTQGKRFSPVRIAGNPFAYLPARVPPGGTLPAFGSAADLSPIGGSLVLFKLTLSALANRPLELRIRSGQAPAHEGTVELDV
ncbi:MAG: hypothetical protein ACJ76S_09045 [Solirubrobacteraceae bacterium]